MLKRLAAVLAGLIVAASAMAAKPEPPVDEFFHDLSPLLIVTPEMQELSQNDIIISKEIFTDPSNPLQTSLTLLLQQNISGKLTGVAKFASNKPVSGNPSISLPVEIPVKGKISKAKQGVDPSFTLKGKLKVAGGAEYHSRTVALSVTGVMDLDTFTLPNFDGNNDVFSTSSYSMKVNISGLGTKYNYQSDDVIVKSNNSFNFQPALDTAGLKRRKTSNQYYFGVSVPGGYYTTMVTADIGTSTTFAPESLNASTSAALAKALETIAPLENVDITSITAVATVPATLNFKDKKLKAAVKVLKFHLQFNSPILISGSEYTEISFIVPMVSTDIKTGLGNLIFTNQDDLDYAIYYYYIIYPTL